MNVELKDIHIGQAIKKRLEELDMKKTEFGRLIDTPQQHVNRIFDRDTIETKKLVRICKALDYNFFALFCSFSTQISAYLSAIAMGDGDANNAIGETAVLSQLEVLKVKMDGASKVEADLRDQIEGLKKNIDQLNANLKDKDEIINLLRKKG